MSNILNLLSISPLFLLKMFFLLFEVLYFLFAFVLYRQERLMSHIIEVPIESFFKLLMLAHVFLSLALLIFSLILL